MAVVAVALAAAVYVCGDGASNAGGACSKALVAAAASAAVAAVAVQLLN